MSNFQFIERGDGWLEVCFDQPDSKANVFTEGALKELNEVAKKLEERRDLKGVIFTSAKNDIFIAGADIKLILSMDTFDKALDGCTFGQQAIHKIAKLPYETVAAINGACLGGGFELALACKKRVASDNKNVKIGLPEVNLGILPGFGGSVRLPRLVKLQTALDLILSGKQLDGMRAYKAGCVDAVLPFQDFNKRAFDWAKANSGKPGNRVRKAMLDKFMETGFGLKIVLKQARKTVMAKTKGVYPAPLKIIDLIGETFGQPMEASLEKEARGFAVLAVTSVSKRLIELFMLAESVKKTNGVGDDVKATKIERAACLGAGVMGGGIAWAFANKDIPLRMKDLNTDGLALGYTQVAENFGFSLKTKKLTKKQYAGKMAMISHSLDYSGFKNVDVVVEAVVENMDVKKKVLQETEKYISPTCILASNTSSLSISEMQSACAHPERVGGFHFFNPVSRMPLVEVIAGEKTNKETVATLFELAKKLGKTPIVVKDGPGFLVNRLLMPYMNEAMFLLEEGVSIERLDQVMQDFGMPMGPIRLVDEVGIDVGAKVAKIIHNAFGIRAEACHIADKISKSGRLGKKNGKGFYRYVDGKPAGVDESIYSEFTVKSQKAKSYSDEQLVQRMIFPMINEAALALDEKIVAGPGEVDLGMIMGTGFPPFRGGVLRYADSIGVQAVVDSLAKFSQEGAGDRLNPNKVLQEVAKRGGFYK